IDRVSKVHDGGVWVEQAVIAGCSGGIFDNLCAAADILRGGSIGNGAFSLSVYPDSMPSYQQLMRNGVLGDLTAAGAIVRECFCGPCFGAGDTPANGELSIRHTTRNFPNREGSKPGEGQLSCVALMDARSIAATARNGGRLTPATDLDWSAPELSQVDLHYRFEPLIYHRRVFNGFGHAQPETPLVFGPNIADWPRMSPLPQHLLLQVASVITDPVTTTDELIPSGETSSLRSNPSKLAEYTLSRKDPGYVERAKAVQQMEKRRQEHPDDPHLLATARALFALCGQDLLPSGADLKNVGLGSTIFALKPGDGSAREQAASCQKVLGGWANLAAEYATKRYRSNLINWGMLPFIVSPDLAQTLRVGDWLAVPHIRDAVQNASPGILAYVLRPDAPDGAKCEQIALTLRELTADERQIILDGCLINFYNNSRGK
ncbi:aconitase family protein, partial [uncultured Desulfovibrio sp.]|uniref:aconitase family protein n=1 Tax=uncultured Desulfovibrio sp. TaxID=167968 RepID=UPI0026DD6CFB